MRIVFMGTPAFASTSLAALVKAGSEVVGVVTAPDKAAGRGQKLRESDVKQVANELGLRVLQPTNLKLEEFITALRGLKPDLIVVVAFRMLPREVWQVPDKGTINLHASLLPQYRGAAPINWAIINGEKETGLTTFFINENIDTGDLIMQSRVAIGPDDDAGSLHDKLMAAGAELLVNTVNSIALGNAPRIPQQTEGELKSAPKIFKEDTRINWDQPAGVVRNFIRGMSPYPAATSILKEEGQQTDLKIFSAKEISRNEEAMAGMVAVDRRSLMVACSPGWLEITELQPAGKRRMPIGDFLNGFKVSEGAKMA